MKQKLINEAILSAERSTLRVANHGAIVVLRGKVIGRGYNKYCVENVNKVNRWSIHAEVDAINNALRKVSSVDLRKSILIVVRKKMNEEIGLSAPCQCCANYITRWGIKTCFYS